MSMAIIPHDAIKNKIEEGDFLFRLTTESQPIIYIVQSIEYLTLIGRKEDLKIMVLDTKENVTKRLYDWDKTIVIHPTDVEQFLEDDAHSKARDHFINPKNYVGALANRFFWLIRRYRDITGRISNHEAFPELLLSKEEEGYQGFYENDFEEMNDNIIITNIGLYIYQNSRWIPIKYSQIKYIQLPKNKENVLLLYFAKEKSFELSVKDNRLHFFRFLNRVKFHLTEQKLLMLLREP